MAKKTYTLEVDVEASSQTLDEAIEKMEKMVELKGQLKGGVFSIPDGDVKKIVETKAQIDGLSDSIKKQKTVISELEKAKQKLEKSRSDEAQQIAKITYETNKQNKANKDAAAAQDKLLKDRVSKAEKAAQVIIAAQKKEADEKVKALKKEEAELIKRQALEKKAEMAILSNLDKIQKALKTEEVIAKKAADAEAKFAKAREEANRPYNKLSKILLDNQKAVRDLLASEKQLTAEDKKLIEETNRLNKKLVDIDHSMGNGRRTVGLYKQAIHDALSETGAFNGVLGQTAAAFKTVQQAEEAAGNGAKSFSTILKASGVGLLVAGIAALVKVFTDVTDANQAFQDQLLRLNTAFSDVSIKNYIATLQSTRPELRKLSKDIQALVNDDQDLKDIIADQTVSIGVRDAALAASIALSERKADLEIKAAEANLRNVNAEVAMNETLKGGASVLEELLIKQVDAENKLSEAKSNRATVDAESLRRQRQLSQEAIINNVELTRSNKLTANAAAVERQNALNDEKRQLEERKAIAIELQGINLRTIDAEAEELEKAGISRKLFDEAVATGDEVQLKNLVRRKAAFIEGTAIEAEFFKVVKQAQENQIRNNETNKKLQEEELKRRQRLLEIEREIGIIKQETEIKRAEDNANTKTDLNEKLNDEALTLENALNFKLLKLRKKAAEQSKEAELNVFNEKARLLDLQRQKDLEAIDNSISDEQVKAKEKLKIEEKYQADLEALRTEGLNKALAIDQKELEERKKISQRQVVIVAEQLDKITSQINDQLDKRSQLELDRIDKQEEMNDEALQRQIKRAEEGKVNDVETYQLKQAQLEKAKADQEKKDKRREKVLAYYNLLSGYAKEDANTALPRAARDIAISEAISAAFAEKGGIAGEVSDSTTLGSSKTHGPGRDVLVVADKDEGILSTRQMKALGGREGFYNLQSMLNNQQSDNVLFPEVPTFTNVSVSNNTRVEEKLNELIEITKKKPVPQSKMDNVGNVITTTFEDGKRHILKVMTKKPGFRR